jgi:hypothetical protein
VSRPLELAATTAAGAAGALLALVAVGANLLLAIPAAIGVGGVSLVASRSRG